MDATAATGNPGVAEMIFYSVPEASTTMLAGLAAMFTLTRRRR